MMKYLLVCLLLTVPWFTGGAGPVPLPTRLELDASFDVPIGRSVENVYVTVAHWPERVRVALHIDEVNPACGRDSSCVRRLFSGDGRALVVPGDVVIARDLRWAAIHTTLHVTDDRSHLTVVVKIDLAMHAQGGFHRGDGSGNPGYFNATATGVIASATMTFAGPDQVSTRGLIARSAL